MRLSGNLRFECIANEVPSKGRSWALGLLDFNGHFAIGPVDIINTEHLDQLLQDARRTLKVLPAWFDRISFSGCYKTRTELL